MLYLMSIIYIIIAFLFSTKLAVAFALGSLVLAVFGKMKLSNYINERVFVISAIFALYELITLSFKLKDESINESLFIALTVVSYAGISIFASYIKDRTNLSIYCTGLTLIFADVCFNLKDFSHVLPLALAFICATGAIFYLSKNRISTEQSAKRHKDKLENILKAVPDTLLKFEHGNLVILNKTGFVIDDLFVKYLQSRVNSESISVPEMYSGEHGFYEVTLYELPEKSGHLVLAKDITQKIDQDRELESNKTQLLNSSKLAALGEMAGGVAHEINNPLQILSLSTEQLRLFFMTDEINQHECEKICDQMEGTIDRINNIVKGMKIISRDGQEDPFETANASDIVHETLKFCKEKFKNHGVKLYVYEQQDTDYSIKAQRVRLSQVVLNILNNAFDATSVNENRIIRVSLGTDENNNVVISLGDNGPGVPESLSQKVFQPFFTTKEVGKGTGLGLSISKGIIEQHQGEFLLDQVERSKFTIKIPMAAGA